MDTPCDILFRRLWINRINIWASDILVSLGARIMTARYSLERRDGNLSDQSLTPYLWSSDGVPRNTECVFVCSLDYCPGCRLFKSRREQWTQDADTLWNVEKRLILTSDDSVATEGTMMAAHALAVKYASIPPFVIRRCGCHTHQRESERVGPWSIPRDQKSVVDLKRWIYGSDSALGARDYRDLMRRCAQRRIRRHGLTASEQRFFAAMFSATKVTQWIKNRNNPHHEYAH